MNGAVDALLADAIDGLDDITIASSWREAQRARMSDAMAQTEVIGRADRSLQAIERVEQEVQAGADQKASLPTAPVAVDEARLAAFVRRAAILIDGELTRAINQKEAFEEFALAGRQAGHDQAELSYSLRQAGVPHASALAWNSSGHVIAVAYGRLDHLGWCQHQSRVSTWNLAKRALDPVNPDRSFELDCCALSIAFHPRLPGLLAVGLFSGQICIYQISDDEGDPVLMKTHIDDLAHREPVAHVEWVRSPHRNEFTIASVSGDGKVFVWSMENNMQHPMGGVRLMPTSQYHGHGTTTNKNAILGGTTLGFSPFVDGVVVVGTEGGGVLRCLLNGAPDRRQPDIREGGQVWSAHARALVGSNFDVKRHVERDAVLRGLKRIDAADVFSSRPPAAKLYPSACSMAYESHMGPVYTVAFCPLHRHLFLTCSSDGYLRVYHSMRLSPMISIEVSGTGLMSARWSPTRPLVVVAGDARGVLHIFDLQASAHTPVLSIPVNQSGASVTSVVFNSSDGSIVATSDLDGNVAIWNLSARLTQPQPRESELIESWGAMTDADDITISGAA